MKSQRGRGAGPTTILQMDKKIVKLILVCASGGWQSNMKNDMKKKSFYYLLFPFLQVG